MAETTSNVQNAGTLSVREVTTPASGGVQQVISQADAVTGALAAILASGAQQTNLASTQGNQPLVTATNLAVGTPVGANVAASGNGTIYMVGGTFTNLPIVFEWSPDATSVSTGNWFAMETTSGTGAATVNVGTTLTGPGFYAWNVPLGAGVAWIRVRQTAAGTVTTAPTIGIAQGPFVIDPSPVVQPVQPSNAVRSSVASSAAAVQLLAANVMRRGAICVNESNQTLYLAYGSAGSTTDYTYAVPPNQTWVMDQPAYSGVIYGIWSAAQGFARLTELSS